jgi:methylated-DNA-[protein]-cysteine S-methyltransferase
VAVVHTHQNTVSADPVAARPAGRLTCARCATGSGRSVFCLSSVPEAAALTGTTLEENIMATAIATTIPPTGSSAAGVEMVTTHRDTPVGRLILSATPAGVARVRTANSRRPIQDSNRDRGSAQAWTLLDRTCRELDEYFACRRTCFDVPVDLGQADGERRMVLETLAQHVRHGETTTYGALADALGLTGDGARRIGGALAGNPVLIIVPCHRVLGVNGKLTGYAGGLEAKQALLGLERRDKVGDQLMLDVR